MRLDIDDCGGILESLDRLVRTVRPKQYPLKSRHHDDVTPKFIPKL